MNKNRQYFLPGSAFKQSCDLYKEQSTNHMPLQAHRGSLVFLGGITALAAMPGTVGEVARGFAWAPTAGTFIAARVAIGFTLKNHFAVNDSNADSTPTTLRAVPDYDLDLPA